MINWKCGISLLAILLAAQSAFGNPRPTAVTGEYLVKLKNPAANIFKALSRSVSKEQITPVLPKEGVYKIKLEGNTNLRLVRHSHAVKYIEPNYLFYPSAAPDDPDYAKQWGLKNSIPHFDIGAEMAWNETVGNRDVIVAVVDTGVDYRHPDLQNNIWTNEKEAGGQPGVDDDGNGYVDDVYGYDFINKDTDPHDDMNHGTHCAGIIGASGNNGTGITGVNWQVRIMALKFMNPDTGGSSENSLLAMDYAAKNGARIINASWGGGLRSQIFEEMLQSLAERGVLFVAAAGNAGKNTDFNRYFPAGYPVENVISVGALDQSGNLADFSNFGPNSVDIAAPGVKIFSTFTDGRYGLLSGTSMAAPHVSGVAALVLAKNPQLTLAELKARLLKRGYRMKALKGRIASSALLNAAGAVTDIRPVPEFDPDDPDQWKSIPHSLASPAPYANNAQLTFEVHAPGAKRLSLFFSRFRTEEGFDLLRIYDRDGKLAGVMSGTLDESYSPIVDGDYARLVFESDESNVGGGFSVERINFEEL